MARSLWNCPPSYLLDRALPALEAGAQEAGRARPPLVAHAWVALSTDRDAVRAAAHKSLATYAKLPFYINMFTTAGYPLTPEGTISDALIDALVIAGDAAAAGARIRELLASGLDELLLTPVGLEDPAGHRSQIFEADRRAGITTSITAVGATHVSPASDVRERWEAMGQGIAYRCNVVGQRCRGETRVARSDFVIASDGEAMGQCISTRATQ